MNKSKLAAFMTWKEAREALALMRAVYPDDDFRLHLRSAA